MKHIKLPKQKINAEGNMIGVKDGFLTRTITIEIGADTTRWYVTINKEKYTVFSCRYEQGIWILGRKV